MKYLLIVVCVLAVLMTGCANSGMFAASNITEVQLNKANFKIVQKDVSGEATSGYIFGVSQSFGAASMTFAVAHVSGSQMIYKDALADLWKNAEKTLTSVEGKKLALVNVRYDANVINMAVYTQVTISVRADIVEFTE